MRRGSAFTLVELLVVIGIIAVLLGLLLPVTAKARQQSRITACAAQLHDIGAAFQMYINQYKGKYPPAVTLPGATPDNATKLQDYLAPYVGRQMRIFRCPSDYSDGAIYDMKLADGSLCGISYYYYAEMGERPLHETFFYKVFKVPARIPLLWDAANFHGGTIPYNWLCLDGHVERFLTDADQARTLLEKQQSQ